MWPSQPSVFPTIRPGPLPPCASTQGHDCDVSHAVTAEAKPSKTSNWTCCDAHLWKAATVLWGGQAATWKGHVQVSWCTGGSRPTRTSSQESEGTFGWSQLPVLRSPWVIVSQAEMSCLCLALPDLQICEQNKYCFTSLKFGVGYYAAIGNWNTDDAKSKCWELFSFGYLSLTLLCLQYVIL